MDKLRRRVETLDSEIKEKWKFKDFYQFKFNFAKNPGQKILGRHHWNQWCINDYLIGMFVCVCIRIGHGDIVLEHCHEGEV